MSQAEAAALRSAGLLFERPADSAADWPNARGVFAGCSRSFCIWANEEDHLRLRVTLAGGQLVETFRQFCQLEDVVREGLKRGDHAYAQHVGSGFLTPSPNKLGTDGMRVGAVLRLPKLLAWEALPSLAFRIGGDGYETSWHFDDPLKLIGGYQYNGLQRSLDGGATGAVRRLTSQFKT